MIAAMDQLVLVGRKSVTQELLTKLQGLGVVHVEPLADEALEAFQLSADELALKARWDAIAAQSGNLLSLLDADPYTQGATLSDESLEGLEGTLTNITTKVEGAVAQRVEIADELDLLGVYLRPLREVAPSLARFDDSRFLQGMALIVPSEEAVEGLREQIAEELPERVVLSAQPYGAEWLVTAAAIKGDVEALRRIIGREGYSELALPEHYAEHGVAKAVHVMEERSQSLPKRLREVEAELSQLDKQHSATLKAICDKAHNQQVRYGALSQLGESRYGMALRGWVPRKETDGVVKELNKTLSNDIIIETRPADEHHDHNVPTKLENNAIVRPFEGLLSLFAPPKYGNFDPSWTLAIFFPFFFGLVVGDIGFGLMFLSLGLWLAMRKKPVSLGPIGITLKPAALPTISTIIIWCAAWTIVWGFLYGEFFGNFLEKWPESKPIFYALHHDAPADAHGDTGDTVAPADSHAADSHAADDHAEDTGHATAAADDAHATDDGHGDAHGAAHPQGWIPILIHRATVYQPILLLSLAFGVFQVLWGWLLRAFYGFKHSDKKHLWEGIGMFSGLAALVIFAYGYLTNGLNAGITTVVVIGFAIFLFSVLMSGMPLMLVELISNGGNILSYLRLFAVGLSAALVANLATDLGFAVSGTLPIIGPILGILLALVVHIIALALTIIGHTLQPLRLQYVEFFTKFGFYDESGQPYNPLKLTGGQA